MRMVTIPALFLLPLFWTLVGAVGAVGDDVGREAAIVARGAWPHLPTHEGARNPAQNQWVVRRQDDLAKLAGAGGLITVPKALGVQSVDFTKQMLLVVEDGTQPLVGVSGGGAPSAPSTIEIARVAVDDAGKTMTVGWRLAPRDKDSPIITGPLAAVIVDRFDGDVKFAKLPSKADVPKDEPAVAGKGVPIRGRAFWPDGWPSEAPRKEWVIRSTEELIDSRLRAPEPVLEEMREKALAQYIRALKVAKIDFGTQMIVGVSGGVQPAGTSVEVLRVDVGTEGMMKVHWRLRSTPAEAKAAEMAHPAAVVLVEQFPGKVRFLEEKSKDD